MDDSLSGRPPDARDKRRMSAQMVYAAEQGQTSEAIHLLERGADPDSADDNGCPAIVWAARRGDVRLMDELLRRGAKPDAADGAGTTPLMWAIRDGRDVAAERLLAAGADVRQTDGKGHTALHFAAARGNKPVVERLLMRGAERDAVDEFNDTPLTLAAAGAHFDTVLLLANGGADLNARGNGGRTAFLLAVMEGRTPSGEEKARLLGALLARGADPETPDDYGWTPLMRAAHSGDEVVMRLLLDRGCEAGQRDGQGLTAFHWAAQGGKVGAMQLLVQRGADIDARDSQGQTALFRQMRDPDSLVVMYLLEAGADVNSTSDRGDSVLIAAVRKQNDKMVSRLLDNGADIHAVDRNRETVLDIAIKGGMDELAHVLTNRGARSGVSLCESLGLPGGIDEPDDRGWTPLGKAARDNDAGRIHLLVDAGANIECTTEDGVTPLMIAAERSSVETLQVLVDRGAKIVARDSAGNSVLHHAISGQRVDNVQALVAAGAAVDEAGREGITPLMAAIAQYDNEIAAELLGAGADIEKRDERGRTALLVAVESRNAEMVTRLLSMGADTSAEDSEGRTAEILAGSLNEPDLAERVSGSGAPTAVPEPPTTPDSVPKPPSRPDPGPWAVPDSVLEKLAAMFPDEPAQGVEPSRETPPRPGFMLPPEREVDCDCDSRFQRPVYRDHTGINYRVSACLRCGEVTVTETVVDEPHPNDVQCVGNVIQAVKPDALAWLASWPRLAWGVWNEDRSIYLPTSLRCQSIEGLEQAERAALAAQASLGLRERIEQAGFPAEPAPRSLATQLKTFAETWDGLQLTEETPAELLWAHSVDTTWAAPFAQAILLRKPNIMEETATRFRSADPKRFRAAKSLVDRQRLNDPAIVSAVIDRLRDAPLTESQVGPLLDTLYYIGPAAAGARPLLKEMARRVGERQYYFHKRLMQVYDLLAPQRERGR